MKNRAFHFYCISNWYTKTKEIFIVSPAKKRKLKKRPDFMRGKAQHQKYGKFNKNTAKKAFANKKMLKFSSIITSINTMQ